jgi:3-dehydroquinate synthetase
MVAAAMISSQLGLCDHSFVELHRSILKSHELPTRIPSGVSIERVLETLSFDKKERGGETPFVLLAGPQRLASRKGSSLIAVPSVIILDVLRLLAQPLAGYLAA